GRGGARFVPRARGLSKWGWGKKTPPTPATILWRSTGPFASGYRDFTSAATPDTNPADAELPSMVVYHSSGLVESLHRTQDPRASVVVIEMPGAARCTVEGPKPVLI